MLHMLENIKKKYNLFKYDYFSRFDDKIKKQKTLFRGNFTLVNITPYNDASNISHYIKDELIKMKLHVEFEYGDEKINNCFAIDTSIDVNSVLCAISTIVKNRDTNIKNIFC